MEANGSCPYHPRATPRKVIGKTRHIMTSEVLYKAIYALNATTCSTGSESPSYASNVGRQKICGTGVHQTPGRAAQRGMFESCRDLRWVVDKLALGELRYVGDNCLEHSRYGLDLVGKPLKGLWSYHRDLETKWRRS
ncbi:hypothetical protein BHM03_00006872 [Ensete ventricosum]|nr:hypothetical protein BHM03_00006872 [Ensete ventricosum]